MYMEVCAGILGIYGYIKDVPEPDWTGFYNDFSDRNGSFGPDRIFVPNRTVSEWTGFDFGPDRTETDLIHDWTGMNFSTFPTF